MANNYKISFQADIKNIKSIEQQVTQLQKKINGLKLTNLEKSAKDSAKALNSIFTKGNLQAVEKYRNFYNDQVASMSAQAKSVKALSKDFQEMSKAQDSQTSKNYQKYYNDLAGGINNQTKSVKASANAFQEMSKAQDSQTSKNYQKYYNDLAGGINNQTKSAKESANAFKELFATTQKGYTGLNDVSKKTVDLTGGMKTLAKGTMSFTDRVKEAVSSSIQWTIAMGGLYASIHKVQEAIQTVIALDNQMTNIRMVTGASIQQAEEYLKTYEQIAEQTSSTTLEVAKSAETWLNFRSAI